jgi:hypothetical protein
MNKATRKILSGLVADAEKITSMIEDLKSQLETIRDEEQEKYDNMPESIQSGDRGEAASAAIDALENAIGKLDGIDDLVSDVSEAMA